VDCFTKLDPLFLFVGRLFLRVNRAGAGRLTELCPGCKSLVVALRELLFTWEVLGLEYILNSSDISTGMSGVWFASICWTVSESIMGASLVAIFLGFNLNTQFLRI
jgi:hypothetical protein